MQENIKDKETYRFMYPTGIVSYVFLFSDRALQWLCGTTTDDGGRTAGNFTLLGDLLARMALTTEEAKGFRRRHYKIFCVNGKYGIQFRVSYFLFYRFAK